jgi:hypothetical protein
MAVRFPGVRVGEVGTEEFFWDGESGDGGDGKRGISAGTGIGAGGILGRTRGSR